MSSLNFSAAILSVTKTEFLLISSLSLLESCTESECHIHAETEVFLINTQMWNEQVDINSLLHLSETFQSVVDGMGSMEMLRPARLLRPRLGLINEKFGT